MLGTEETSYHSSTFNKKQTCTLFFMVLQKLHILSQRQGIYHSYKINFVNQIVIKLQRTPVYGHLRGPQHSSGTDVADAPAL